MIAVRRALACTLAVLFLMAHPARGSQIASIDLRELPELSSLIIVGTVIDTRTSQETNAFLEKTSTIEVSAVLRGEYPSRVLRVRTRTGLVSFDRHLVKDESGVFFLKPATGGDFEAAYPGGFALLPKGAFMAGTCLTATTLNGMTITLDVAQRIRAVAERYLAALKRSEEPLPPVSDPYIDCEGTPRFGPWLLEPSSTESELRLTYRLAQTKVSMIREEMRIRRDGTGWKVLGMGQVMYHSRR